MCQLCIEQTIDQSTIFLDCSDCKKIETLPESLPNLKFLVIYGTNISEVPAYPSLEGLYIMDCPIESLPYLPKLTKLNACGSKLQSIPDNFYRLQHILIDRTPINNLPDTLISCTNISANGCTQLSNISNKLINLESLSIAKSSISSIPSLMSLQYINIGGTTINELPLDKLPSLRKVFAKGCSLNDPFTIIDRGIDLTN